MRRRLERFSIVVDSNEYHHGKTWIFPDHRISVRSLLSYGCDYSIRGLVGTVGVERKSYQDFINCVGSSWKRFQKQLAKLRRNKYYCVVIEGAIGDPIEYSRMIDAAVIIRTAQITSLGIPVVFATTRKNARDMCIRFLEACMKRIRGLP